MSEKHLIRFVFLSFDALKIIVVLECNKFNYLIFLDSSKNEKNF